MLLSMSMIACRLKCYNPQVYLAEDKPVIKKLKLLQKKQRVFDRTCVYLGTHRHLPRNLNGESPANIIILGNKESTLSIQSKNACNLILLSEDLDSTTVFNEILDIFEFYRHWDSELQDALIKDKGLQYLVDISFKVFGNPMYIIDSSFRTLAYTKEVGSDAMDALWKSIVTEGHTDIATVNAMKENDALTWLNSCREPIINTSPIFSRPRINANIMKGTDKIGTLIVIQEFNQLEEAHLHMAKHLVNVVLLALQKDQIYQNTRGEIYNYFFADLLEGKILKQRLVEHQLRFLGWSIHDRYFVVKVKVDEHDLLNNTLDYTAHQLENICWDSRAIIYHNAIILIINTRKSTRLEKDSLYRLEHFLMESKLVAGLSSCCGNILEIRDFYLQAAITVKLAELFKRTGSLFQYDDYVLYHLIYNAAKNMDLHKLCHPAVIQLQAHDQENGTNYYHTLRVYINNDKNLVESSKALFIHRNTLVYRINKIMELISIDLSDENVKSHILLSYKIIDYLQSTEKIEFAFEDSVRDLAAIKAGTSSSPAVVFCEDPATGDTNPVLRGKYCLQESPQQEG